MRKYSVLLMGIVLVLSFVTVAAVAQPFGGGQGNGPSNGTEGIQGNGSPRFGAGPGGPGAEGPRQQAGPLGINGLMRLELTDQQREDIQFLMEEYRAVMEELRSTNQETAEALRDELISIMEADVFDPDAAYAVLADKAALRIEGDLLRLEYQHFILNEILTEEQREELQNMWQNQAAFGRGPGQGPADGQELGECPYM